MFTYMGMVMGMIILCIMHTKTWFHIICRSALYMEKYSTLHGTVDCKTARLSR